MDVGVVETWLACLLALCWCSCDRISGSSAEAQTRATSSASGPSPKPTFRARRTTPEQRLTESEFRRDYPWKGPREKWPRAATLEQTFRSPPAFERVELVEGSWGAFLRKLPLRLDRTTVLTYQGRPIDAPAAAVALLPVGDRNLQQCADAILRLRAEWLWASETPEEISFHFTSGDRSSWTDWAAGERFRIDGADVERVRSAAADSSRSNFLDYLRHLFTYAGTRSLPLDTRTVAENENIDPGDLFVDPGSPGHAVLVLDVAVDGNGRRIALLGQSFMPAQEFHVLESPDALGGVWFPLPTGAEDRLVTPVWSPFGRDRARRFPNRTPN